MFLAVLLQGSLLVSPMYLDEAPPEARAVRAIVVPHGDVVREGVARSQRSREDALALAGRIARDVRAGADFEALAREHSGHASSVRGGVLGTYWPGMLAPELDHFLFSAELGATSDPLESGPRFFVIQRIDEVAACRQILVDGVDAKARDRCRELLERARAGADFAQLAREESADAASAARGGALAIFVRGPEDSLVKAAAFRARVGEIVGPIESPLGFHLVKRVPVSELDPSLLELTRGRVRALLIAFAGAKGANAEVGREADEAEAFAGELATRIRRGEAMAELARVYDDDRGGRERSGDLGWVLRGAPGVPSFLDRAFTAPLGELVGPVATDSGWLLLRRER